MRDLVFKIVPTKAIVRELKTSTGKVLTKDSEYILIEKKRQVKVGKKTQVDYVFELDIKENSSGAAGGEETKEGGENSKDKDPFYANLEDWNLFKLRSALFLVDFPLTFTISIINVWLKNLPNPTTDSGWSKDEVEQIAQTKQTIRDFFNGICTHLNHLQQYMQEVKAQNLLRQNYVKIVKGPAYKEFRNVMVKSQGTSLIPTKVDEQVKKIFETINYAQNECIDACMKELKKKIDMIRAI